MPDHPNQPQEYDAVLGGQTPIPAGSAVLGGIEGVKRRLASQFEEQRIAALSEALKYGESGLDLLIRALWDESIQVEEMAYLLLKERVEPRVIQALKSDNPWAFLKCLRTWDEHGDVEAVAISSDGHTIFSAIYDDDGSDFVHCRLFIRSFNLSTGYSQEIFRCCEYNVDSVAFSPDGKVIVTGSYGIIDIRHLPAREVIRNIEGNPDHIKSLSIIKSLAISPDRSIIAGSPGYDKTIKIWHLETGVLIRTLEGHSNGVASVAISPDGQSLFSGSYDKTIKIWHLETGVLIRTLEGHPDYATSIAISPDGETLICGYEHSNIKIWHLKTGELLRTLEGSAQVTSVAISSDGKTIVSGSTDSTIKIWGVP